MNPKYYAALRNYCSRYGIDWRFDTIQNPITLIWEVLKVVNKLTQDMIELKELMKNELENIVNEMVEDGTLGSLINDVLFNTKADKRDSISIKEFTKDSIDDLGAIINMLLENNYNIIYLDGRNYSVKTKIDITRDNIVIDGEGATLTCEFDGLPYMMTVTEVSDFTIKNVNFNSNNRGRGGLDLIRSKRSIVENCRFTGYTFDFGWYATDSLLLVDGSPDTLINSCHFYDSGYLSGTTTSQLNRAISFGKLSDNSVVSNCSFNNLSQGIVIDADNVIISGNSFREIRDNNIYTFAKNVLIDSNYFHNGYDEGVVVSGDNVTISNNTFINCVNRAIALNGNSELIRVINNSVKTETAGMFLESRNNTFRVNTLIIDGNTFSIKDTVGGLREFIMNVLHVDYLKLTDNVFTVNGNSVKNIMRQGETIKSLIIHGNIFRSLIGTDVNVKTGPGTTVWTKILNNYLENTRAPKSFTSLPFMQSNVAYEVNGGKALFQVLAIPTFTGQVGDMALNISGVSGQPFGWVYTADGWKSLGSVTA